MKTMRVWFAILVASFLVIMSGQNSGGQDFQSDSVRDAAATLSPEQKNDLLKPLLADLLNDPEFKRELVKEITRSMGPEVIKALADSIASECARDPQFRKEVLRFVMSSATSQLKDMFASAGHGTRSMNPATLMSLISAVTSRGIADGRTQSFENGSRNSIDPGKSESPGLSGDFISVFVNPENQIRPLSTDEARKLFTGEYANWKRLGGPDLAVKVVTWNEGIRALENLVGQRVAPEAVRVRYLSLIIPAVSLSKGAVAFLPVSLVEGLPFIEKHEAVRNVSVSSDADAIPETVRRNSPEDTMAGGVGTGTSPENIDRHLVTVSAK